jgi:hypothetical protein
MRRVSFWDIWHMGTPVDFVGTNVTLTAHPDNKETVQDMRAFRNGFHMITAWVFTPEEMEQIIRTGVVYLAVLSGRSSPPVFVGSEESVRHICADVGVWKR